MGRLKAILFPTLIVFVSQWLFLSHFCEPDRGNDLFDPSRYQGRQSAPEAAAGTPAESTEVAPPDVAEEAPQESTEVAPAEPAEKTPEEVADEQKQMKIKMNEAMLKKLSDIVNEGQLLTNLDPIMKAFIEEFAKLFDPKTDSGLIIVKIIDALEKRDLVLPSWSLPNVELVKNIHRIIGHYTDIAESHDKKSALIRLSKKIKEHVNLLIGYVALRPVIMMETLLIDNREMDNSISFSYIRFIGEIHDKVDQILAIFPEFLPTLSLETIYQIPSSILLNVPVREDAIDPLIEVFRTLSSFETRSELVGQKLKDLLEGDDAAGKLLKKNPSFWRMISIHLKHETLFKQNIQGMIPLIEKAVPELTALIPKNLQFLPFL